MSTLSQWQKITRVLPGQPFGNGSTGSATISSDPNTRATITGTATQTTGTAGSTAFSDGDVVVLHQTQGTGAGQWEINKISVGGGTTSLTFQVALKYTYGTGAQIIKIPQYTTATIGSYTPTAWNGTTGGIDVICASSSISGSGTLNANAIGFRGGQGFSTHASYGYTGEGTVGGSSRTGNNDPNGNGGGAGTGQGGYGDGSSGGAGGNIIAGGNGQDGTGAKGKGGLAVGSADLIILVLSGGGGSGGTTDNTNSAAGAGGTGAGIVILISKNIDVSSASLNLIGSNGADGVDHGEGGGGGAGGSVLAICQIASLGTTKIVATGGTGGGGYLTGGTGSVGAIAIHHSGTVTGTTNPTFTDVSDPTLIESNAGLLMNFI